MLHDSVHVSTSIDRPPHEVYAFVADPANLSVWAAGLADSPLTQVDGKWTADSPLGRVVVAFVALNDLGVADHDVTLPSGDTVTNPMRIFANGDGCDVVFSVRRLAGMTREEFDADVDAVSRDLATLRSVME
ncbi:SRPBCC family protein, partial [Ilumatobacter sp.]